MTETFITLLLVVLVGDMFFVMGDLRDIKDKLDQIISNKEKE